MSKAHARRRRGRLTAGGVIVMATSFLATVLVIAGLIYAAGTGRRHEAALAAASCEPGLSPSGLPCTTRRMLAGKYLAIMTPATQQLSTDMAAYTASERHNLAAAEAALTAAAASEHAFDTNLAGIAFPPALAPIARALVRADQARAKLTGEQARSSSLTQLRSFNRRVEAADAAVGTEMKLIGAALGAPPATG